MCKDITTVSFILQYLKNGTGRPYGISLLGFTAEFCQGIGNFLTGATIQIHHKNKGSITKLMGFRIPHIINSAHINEF